MTDKAKNMAKTGLELLRTPFPADQIGKLPKPTKRQTDAVKADFKKGIRCKVCNGWHHPEVVHLDYVGHAALTDRLLDCDPKWNWEPVAFADDGTPKFDSGGGMWIRLTVCDVTRLGYGFADGKDGGNALKETIGDALRNAAMRFGAALDLWHKGELHADETATEDDDGNKAADSPPEKESGRRVGAPAEDTTPFMDDPNAAERADKEAARVIGVMGTITDMKEFKAFWGSLVDSQRHIAKRPDVIAAKDDRRAVIGGGKEKA